MPIENSYPVRPEKAFIVDDLLARLRQSPFLIITDYHGLKVDQFSDLRTLLGDAGARYTVVKNTFLNRAAKEAGLPDLIAHLSGQTAIVTGDKDVSAAAKILRKFATDSKKLTIRAGVVESSLFTDKQIDALADLPSKEVLQSQLLGLLQAPASRLLRTLNEPASALARLLQANLDKQGAPAATAEEAPATGEASTEEPAVALPA